MTIAWVIGSGGLLGAALSRELRNSRTELFYPNQSFNWKNPHVLNSQLMDAVAAFASLTSKYDKWEIYWAAGVGTMASPAEALTPETEAFAHLLKLMKSRSEFSTKPGGVALSSSAGAIYAGCIDEVIGDNTLPSPTTPYAKEKLKQENLLREYALNSPNITALMARISTLYGPGGAIGKQQGLITHIARCLLQNKPIQIYVPLDTIRDYLTADDAAEMMVTHMRPIGLRPGAYVRIIASEQPTTIAEIVSIYKRITRRNPRIVTSASKRSGLYTRRIQFRSSASSTPRTSLVVGIAKVMAAERSFYVISPKTLLK